MTASSLPPLVEVLAARVAGLAWDALPPEIVRMAKRCVLDTLGSALHGTATPEAAALAAAADDLGPGGPCTVWGTTRTAPPPVAALLNGLFAWLVNEVSAAGLNVEPWRSLAFGLVVALAVFFGLIALMRRSTQVTLSRSTR